MGKFIRATRAATTIEVFINVENILYVQKAQGYTRIVFNARDKEGIKLLGVSESYEEITSLIEKLS